MISILHPITLFIYITDARSSTRGPREKARQRHAILAAEREVGGSPIGMGKLVCFPSFPAHASLYFT
jgi:hypothetical protein